MIPPRFVTGLLAGTLLALSSACGSEAPPEPTTPVVIIVIDTLRADHLGCYGYDLDTSPLIDEFAGTATLFEANSTQVNTTHASLTSILTGLYVKNHGSYVAVPAYGLSARENVVSIGDRLRPFGYESLAVVSHPFLHVAPEGVDPLPGWDRLSTLEGVPPEERVDSTRADNANRRAFELLDQRSDKPLVLWVHYFDPHTDGTWFYDAPEETRNLFLNHHLAAIGQEQYEAELAQLDPPDRGAWIKRNVPDELREQVMLANGRALYDAEIRFCDARVGELLDRLRADGLYDDALIAVLADHGENLEGSDSGHEAQPFTHHDLYEPVTQVPLIVKLPGQATGQRVAAMTQSIDLLPTILEHLEVPADPPVDGKSLMPFFEGREGELHERVFSEGSSGSSVGVRSPQHKLIHRRNGGNSHIFAWRDDPEELSNLYEAVDPRVRDALETWARDFGTQPGLRIRVRAGVGFGPLELVLRATPDTIVPLEGPPAEVNEDHNELRWLIPEDSETVTLRVLLEHDRQELEWSVRRPGDEQLIDKIWIGGHPLVKSNAVPLWRGVAGDPLEPVEFSVLQDPERKLVQLELLPEQESFVEVDVRYRWPSGTRKMSLLSASGWEPHIGRYRVQSSLKTSDAVRAEVQLAGEQPALIAPRIDGRWPRRAHVRVGEDERLPLDHVQFLFSFPPDFRLTALLGTAPPQTNDPGSIEIWSETVAGGELDASLLDPEVARALQALGYIDSEDMEGR
jgi:arylsulfatase A-like enzyme